MRIDLPMCDFQNCRKRFDGNCIDANHDTCEYKIMAEKAWKYRWHDLRKNPEDLPKDSQMVIVACKFWESHVSYKTAYISRRAYGNVWVENGNAEFGNDIVIAWREIEPFESEVE